ncbi:hypothetical protein [Nitratireductor thuwali]|uniref:Uncharacterized protein n=1 Tax=Nitratireductor thuwali TaxID=2267699 RepID=A0ABY5MUC6_9HYPH|nr:hypothetical protein NTH_03939 [Nitratireductor thuwali]
MTFRGDGAAASKPAAFADGDIIALHLREAVRLAANLRDFEDFKLFAHFARMSIELLNERQIG